MILWAEVSQKIGMGHLMELLSISEVLQEKKILFDFVINDYAPAIDLLDKKKVSFKLTDGVSSEDTLSLLVEYNKDHIIIINHRQISLHIQLELKKSGFYVVIIDQLGGKKICCDLLTNPSINDEWKKYTYVGDTPRCLFGPRYALLRKEFTQLVENKGQVKAHIPSVLVTMGGVDRTGATLRIAQALQKIKVVQKIELVLGRGFPHCHKLDILTDGFEDSRFMVSKGVNNIAKRMSSASVVVNSGGNTLYEMAALGVPGIVLWEDEHEKKQATAFENKGTIKCIGNGISTPVENIQSEIERLLLDKRKLQEMRQNCLTLVDTLGSQRVVSSILGLRSSERSGFEKY